MPYLFYSLARFSWRKESLTLPLSITCFMVNKGCSWIYLRFNPLVPQFFFVDPGGPSQCLYSGPRSELGSTKDKGFPLCFFGFLIFSFSFHVFFQDFAVALQELLARPKPDIVWCDINGEPLSFVGPTISAEFVSKDPSLENLAQLRFKTSRLFSGRQFA